MSLGTGAYGQVFIRDNFAVKRYTKRLSHLIQEYVALQYLADCSYIVKCRGVDFDNMELTMDLYDCSFRDWIREKNEQQRKLLERKNEIEKLHDKKQRLIEWERDYQENESKHYKELMVIVHDVLCGLVELHDRELAHGDIKPSNVLIKKNPLHAVIADCGFVSVARYSKTHNTAPNYRDPVISKDSCHDMFSLGICFLEMFGKLKILKPHNYQDLQELIIEQIPDSGHKKIIYNLVHPDRQRRPNARDLLKTMYNEVPRYWTGPQLTLRVKDNNHYISMDEKMSLIKRNNEIIVDKNNCAYVEIRKLMKKTAHKYEINRCKKGFGVLVYYIERYKVCASEYLIHMLVTLMILSSVFGRSGFRQDAIIVLSDHKYELICINRILKDMLSDRDFINILLSP